MRLFTKFTLTAGLLAAASAAPAFGQLTEVQLDFESPDFDASSGTAVDDAGFDFFFSSTGGTAEVGDFSGFQAEAPFLNVDAPNIVTVAFGDDALAGDQSLVFFTDVNSGLVNDPNNEDPRTLLLNVFQQQTIGADDIGSTVTFDFLFSGATGANFTDSATATAPATAEAFLLTLDSAFNATNNLAFDLSGGVVGQSESGSLSLDLTDEALIGQTLQFGFRNSASDGLNPSVIVDNLSVTVPEPASLAVLGLGGLALAGRRRRKA